MARPAGEKTIVSNRRAFHEYHVEERFEAGVALVGSEVKSLRDGHVSLGEAYATVRDDEVWLVGATIEPVRAGRQQQPRAARATASCCCTAARSRRSARARTRRASR